MKHNPTHSLIAENQITNPCIQLDNGEFVWGFQCWWGDIDSFNKKYSSHIKERITVRPPKNIQPVKIPE